ncbi:MAG: LapA family protein [Pseudomonadota bacterium]
MLIVRIVKFTILFLICIALVVLGVANMEYVSLSLLPEGLRVPGVPPLPDMPLTIIILAAMLLGFVIGEIFEWIRESKHRREVSDRGREIQALKAENARLRAKLADPKEDLPRIAAQ